MVATQRCWSRTRAKVDIFTSGHSFFVNVFPSQPTVRCVGLDLGQCRPWLPMPSPSHIIDIVEIVRFEREYPKVSHMVVADWALSSSHLLWLLRHAPRVFVRR